MGKLTNRPNETGLANLATLCGVPVACLHAITFGPSEKGAAAFFHGRTVPRKLLGSGTRGRKACPKCLSEDAYQRSSWDLRFAAVCPSHSLSLLRDCQSCGRLLSWESRISRCTCGANLREMAATPVPVEQLVATRCVYGLLGDPRYQAEATSLQASAPFRDLFPAEVADLLLRLGTLALPKETSSFSLDWTVNPFMASHVILVASLQAFNDWPHGLYAALSKVDSRYGRVDRPRVRGLINAFERWLGKRRADGRGVVLAEAIEVYRAGCTTFPIKPPFVDLRTP